MKKILPLFFSYLLSLFILLQSKIKIKNKIKNKSKSLIKIRQKKREITIPKIKDIIVLNRDIYLKNSDNKCLTYNKQNKDLRQEICEKKEEQVFTVIENTDQTVTFILKNKMVLDVSGKGTSKGSKLIIYESNKGDNQKFFIIRAAHDLKKFMIVGKDSSMCVDSGINNSKNPFLNYCNPLIPTVYWHIEIIDIKSLVITVPVTKPNKDGKKTPNTTVEIKK
jgi:hypothetical protein